jgi:hypothetical protein
MSKLVFESAVQRANGKPITFTLDGRKFKFQPPKTTAVWLANDAELDERVRVQLDWLSAGLSDEDSDFLVGRLKDFNDPLTPVTLIDVVSGLMEEVAGRPPTQPPD